MASYKAFHSQLTSIMEALTKAAVAEICELVDDSYAELQLEISRSHEENEALRRKLELIETIIARGHRGGVAMLDYGQEDTGGELLGFTVENVRSTGAVLKQPKASWRKRSGRGCVLEPKPVISATTEDVTCAATDSPDDKDVVVIKEEMAREHTSNATDELLLNEDGTEVGPPQADDSEEGPSGIVHATSSSSMKPWGHNSNGLPQSAPDSPGPAGGAGDVSSDGEASSTGKKRKPLFLGPGSPTATGEMKQGVSRIHSLPEPDLCSSWSNQGLPTMLPVSHRQYLESDHRLEKVPDLNTGSFPLALGMCTSRLDPLDLNRYCRDRRFVCSYCGKCFTSSRSLETHVRVHTGERPYSCAQCGKRFTQSGHLKTHQSVHTGERPFACEHCSKRFAGKQNLRIHQQKHHLLETGGAL